MNEPVAAAGGRLVADIGGTNARFALLRDGRPDPASIRSLRGDDYASLEAAVRAYLSGFPGGQVTEAAIAIANPITGDQVRMTNRDWSFSIEGMRQSLGLDRLLMLNDFAALAWSLPSLAPAELRQVGGGTAVDAAPRALIGPGTGLGVSGLVPIPGGGWVPLQTEGGHVNFSPRTEREADILRLVWRQHRHVSVERLVSGMGMGNLYAAIAELEGRPDQLPPPPAEITRRGLEDGDVLCREVLSTFCSMLGTAAGNLALTLGARGGVYVCGGIVPRLGDFFDASPFREAFESKGRFEAYLSPIPVYVMTAEYAALSGAARALSA